MTILDAETQPAHARSGRGEDRVAARTQVARALAPVATLGVVTVAWWIAADLAPASDSVLRRFAPQHAFAETWRLITSLEIVDDVVVSLRRIAIGLAIASVVGGALGVVLGISGRVERATSALFQLVRMVSPLAWAPLAIIVFGVGDAPVHFLLAIGAMWPIMINTAAGIQQLDRRWMQVAHTLGATSAETMRAVVLPGIRPHALTGFRVALGIAWVILVPAEMLGVDSGLGYSILDARDRFAYDELAARILIIGALGYLIDTLARRILSKRRPKSSAS